jgi:hypothetical protein
MIMNWFFSQRKYQQSKHKLNFDIKEKTHINQIRILWKITEQINETKVQEEIENENKEKKAHLFGLCYMKMPKKQ